MKAFHEERKGLVKKYEALSAPLLDKRRAVLLGDVDVEKKEEDWEVVAKDAGEEGEVKEGGVPHFWLQAMVNHSMIRGMIEEDDVPALKFVTDIQCVDKEDGTGFMLNFHFAPNPYFANAVLSKSYVVPNLLEEEEAMLESTGGTVINWTSAKKNLCVEEKKMKPKGKSRGGVVVKQVKKDSFFHWFEAVEIPESPEGVDEDEYEELMGRVSCWEGREGGREEGRGRRGGVVQMSPCTRIFHSSTFFPPSLPPFPPVGCRLRRRLHPARGDCAGGHQVVPRGGGGGGERVWR